MMTDSQKEAIRELRIQGYGYGTIAKKLDLKMETVKAHCRRYGLGGKAKDLSCGVNDDTHCKNCGAEITQNPKRKKKLFCCDGCRRKWWNTHMYMVERKAWYDFVCPNCGKEFRVYGNGHRKYCCHECYIEDRFSGKGSK